MKHLPLVIAIVLLVLVSGAFALREMGCRIRTQRLNAELRTALPPLVDLITSYSTSHREDGAWPEPGTIDDDSVLPYMGTRTDDGDRIDTYGTLIDGRRIDIVLSPHGSIRVWVASDGEDR